MRGIVALALGLGVAAATLHPARATVYDAVSSFAALPGASTPFVDGYRIGGTGFIAYDSSTTSCAAIGGLTCNYAAGFKANTLPAVGRNVTGGTIVNGSVVIPTDVLFMHPVGPNSGLAPGDTVLRFVAPTSDVYTVTGSFQILDVSASGVEVSIEGGTSAFDQLLLGPLGTSVTFSFTTALLAGSALDFVVGSAGSYFNDSTGLIASISVPEPASMSLVGLGLVAIGLIRRRRG